MVKEKRGKSLKDKLILRLTSAVLLLAPTLTQAQGWWNTSRIHNRPRWSPYAFTHKKSGLVSGDWKYSMVAFGPKHNGLVPGDVHYNPYAFGVKHNGLIRDHGGRYPKYLPRGFPHPCLDFRVINIITCNYQPHACNDNNKRQEDYKEKLKTRREKLAIQRKEIKKRKKTIETTLNNPTAKTIYDYLTDKKITFRIKDNNFFLPEPKIILTYQNQKTNFIKGYENYKKEGWKIENIISD